MVDMVTPERRSEIMRRIRGKDTRPEMLVRRYLYAEGFRYRLHTKQLPGKPDLVLPKHRACVFVHGCFWHGCPHCGLADRLPKSNISHWKKSSITIKKEISAGFLNLFLSGGDR